MPPGLLYSNDFFKKPCGFRETTLEMREVHVLSSFGFLLIYFLPMSMTLLFVVRIVYEWVCLDTRGPLSEVAD